jgi:hypothetical protein
MTVKTGNVAFDKAYCAERPGYVAGKYVMQCVSDDGCGMDKETQPRETFRAVFHHQEGEAGHWSGAVHGLRYCQAKQRLHQYR